MGSEQRATHGHSRKIDTGDLERWDGGMGVRNKKLLNGYNIYYLGNGYIKSTDFTTMQCSHVIKLHLNLLNV